MHAIKERAAAAEHDQQKTSSLKKSGMFGVKKEAKNKLLNPRTKNGRGRGRAKR